MEISHGGNKGDGFAHLAALQRPGMYFMNGVDNFDGGSPYSVSVLITMPVMALG
jgi:hypothetical protein